MQAAAYPLQLSVDYPDRQLNRWTTFFRLVVIIPILFVLGSVSASTLRSHNGTVEAAGGLLFVGPLLMILFRQKYPQWWFEWNKQLLRFSDRVLVYLFLMDDSYPSTDEEQSVHVDVPYPDVKQDLNRWLPLVKWFLAIPHYVVLFFLGLASLVAIAVAWFAILITGRYPRGLFEFVEGVIRWWNRVLAYAFLLVTDEYPPFRLAA